MFQLDDGTICVIDLKKNCQADVWGLQPSTDALHKDYKFIYSRIVLFPLSYQKTCAIRIGHVNNISTKQFFTGISRDTQSKSYMLSLIDWVYMGIPKSICVNPCTTYTLEYIYLLMWYMPPTNVIIPTKRLQFFLQDESIVLSDSGIPDVSTLLLEIGSSTSPLQIMSLLKLTLVSVGTTGIIRGVSCF